VRALEEDFVIHSRFVERVDSLIDHALDVRRATLIG